MSESSSKRTLQNSSSKRSLYSLTSISKRSLNLNDYVTNEISERKAEQLPPLPSIGSNNDFEDLCNQILFGDALDKILEEEEEEEYDNKTVDSASRTTNKTDTEVSSGNSSPVVTPPQEALRPAFVFGQQLSDTTTSVNNSTADLSSPPRSAFKDLTNTVTNTALSRKPSFSGLKRDISQKSNLKDMLARPNQNSNYPYRSVHNVTAFSGTFAREQDFSLDPRRNASQPANSKVVESLLDRFKEKSNLKSKRKSNGWSYETGSIFGANQGVEDQSSGLTKESDVEMSSFMNHNQGLESLSDFHNMDADVLAHSSTVRTKPLISLPSSSLNPTMSFKNLNDYLRNPDESYVTSSRRASASRNSTTARKQSTKISQPQKSSLAVGRTHSKANSSTSNDFDLISDMSYALDIPTNTFMAQAVTISNHGSAERIVPDHLGHVNRNENMKNNNGNNTLATIYDDTKVNIFEDAPTDTESLDVTSSEGDSIPNVHRKAVSIETLNNTNVLAPSTNVRVSLYVNNNTNSNAILPRETTEEIISKFQMPHEKFSEDAQRRVSSTNATGKGNDAIENSQSVLPMFKDVEEADSEDRSAHKDISFNGLQQKDLEPQPNRVTMLFDADEEEHRKSEEETQQRGKDTPSKTEAVKEHNGTIKTTIKTTKKIREEKIKVRPKVKVMNSTLNEPPAKKSWFKKLFSGLKASREDLRLVQTHKTSLSFEDAHLLTLNEFDKNAVDYFLKSSSRNNVSEIVQYDCKFVKGNFKFRIKIINDGTLRTDKQTLIIIKKKSGRNTSESEHAFQIFNADVARVIRRLELKTKTE